MLYKDFQSSESLLEQRQLFSDCFPENHISSATTQDHYFWKFRGLPGSSPSHEFASYDGPQLIGYYAALPYQYVLNGKPAVCGLVCDVMTHASARGRGVFTELGRFSLQKLRSRAIDFVSGYPIRPEVLPGHLKVGWCEAFVLPLYLKVLRVNSTFRAKKIAALIPLGNFIARAYSFPLTRLRTSDKSYRVEFYNKEAFLELSEYDVFLKNWGNAQKNYLQKDRQFLSWRLGAPGTHYRILTVWKAHHPVAISILRKVNFYEIPCFAMLDLMVIPGEENCLNLLYRHLEIEALWQGVDAIAVMMSRTSAKRLELLGHGFIRSPQKFKLILNRLNNSLQMDSLLDERNWNLMWIDSDDS